MSENESVSAAELNAQADASRTGRAAEAAKETAPVTAKTATAKVAAARKPTAAKPKAAKPTVAKPTAAKPATPAKRTPVPTSGATGTRRALTPAERAERPLTATITEYVKWLRSSKGIGEAKFAKLSRSDLAGYAITLYGPYQVSDDRKADRARGR